MGGGEEAPEIREAEEALKRMLAGDNAHVSADLARAGVASAQAERKGGFGVRDIGVGVIRLQDEADGVNASLVVTDGRREAAIRVELSGTLVATVKAQKEDIAEYVVENVRERVTALPRTVDHFREAVLLNGEHLTL